jgi:hypothetical protein
MNKNRFTVFWQDSSQNILPDKLRVAEVENSSVELGQPFFTGSYFQYHV